MHIDSLSARGMVQDHGHLQVMIDRRGFPHVFEGAGVPTISTQFIHPSCSGRSSEGDIAETAV
jgi:hypothetical protein